MLDKDVTGKLYYSWLLGVDFGTITSERVCRAGIIHKYLASIADVVIS